MLFSNDSPSLNPSENFNWESFVNLWIAVLYCYVSYQLMKDLCLFVLKIFQWAGFFGKPSSPKLNKTLASATQTETESKNELAKKYLGVIPNANFGILVVDEDDEVHVFNVHEELLRSEIPVIFENITKSQQDVGEVRIYDASPQAMGIILKLLYSKTLDEEWNDMVEILLKTGEKYQIKFLMDRIEDEIVKICSPRNIYDFLNLAQKFQLDKAKQKLFPILEAYKDLGMV